MKKSKSNYPDDIPTTENNILVPCDESLLEYARKHANGPPPKLSPGTRASVDEAMENVAEKIAKRISRHS